MRTSKSKTAAIFFDFAYAETMQAMKKFPWPNPNLAALMEEVGELANALLEKKPVHEIFKEAKQVAAMAARIAIEGDPQFKRVEP